MESQVHRKVESYRLDQEIQMRERLAEARKARETELDKLLKGERKSLEKDMLTDVDVRTKSLEEEAEQNALSDLERRFKAERKTMEAALSLRQQELALESEVEMEQRVATFAKERETELLTTLEEQFSKRTDISSKEVKEIMKSLESQLKVKWEKIILDAKQSTLERVSES